MAEVWPGGQRPGAGEGRAGVGVRLGRRVGQRGCRPATAEARGARGPGRGPGGRREGPGESLSGVRAEAGLPGGSGRGAGSRFGATSPPPVAKGVPALRSPAPFLRWCEVRESAGRGKF